MVVAEGGWVMEGGYPFRMQYTVNFEGATAVYDLLAAEPLTVYEKGREPLVVPVEAVMGYRLEIAYIAQCIREKRQPTTVTLTDAAEAVRIVEAEVESARTARAVSL